eukprot:CAMPEP_0178385898 /NCGR_PEP_ID=MMETSP0689_2-20121128/8268_1 /TAXON_ID=160604 /ORGANISM="Amphidinium massartii, Strain CS-259" /LENGTH=72 /DNA_ID=CAMNT_0020006191 /DNA_START=397 /DNA_END=612 /DNA_ORIENTATION=-
MKRMNLACASNILKMPSTPNAQPHAKHAWQTHSVNAGVVASRPVLFPAHQFAASRVEVALSDEVPAHLTISV